MKLYLLYYDIVCYMFAVCMFMVCFVYFMLCWKISNNGSISFDSDNKFMELMWTLIPTLMVLVLCGLKIKFMTKNLDTFCNETMKVVGHQWYWSYEFSDGSFDSFLCSSGFLVDKPLRLIYETSYHLIVTSADVMHSFHVPSLKLKIDAMPGRLNHVFFCPDIYGMFIGYCAELCGVKHSLMPMVMEIVEKNNI